jgi:hypothetical protein
LGECSASADFTDTLATSEDEPGLIFIGKEINGRPVIKGGNIEMLVERLTYYEKYNGEWYCSLRSTTEKELKVRLRHQVHESLHADIPIIYDTCRTPPTTHQSPKPWKWSKAMDIRSLRTSRESYSFK